ncbi:MAG TPA: DMT family transporter [Hyphomicrobiales bacterium]|nr:DMT family transporter [Hyphomicrobiales bacterium]
MQFRHAINRTMTASEWGLLIFLSLLWGSSFIFNDIAVRELPTLTVVVTRVFFAALILFSVTRLAGITMPTDWRIWRSLFIIGLVNNALPFCLIVWGQTHIAAGLASILNATTPLFGVVVAHYFTGDEKLTAGRLAGVITGFAGVAVMIGADALQSLGVNVLAQLAVLSATFCYAVGTIYARRFRGLGLSPLATATGQVTASSILLVPVMLIVDHPWSLPVPSMAAIASLAGVATLSTALAYIIYFRILSTAGATNLLLVTFLIPITAIFLGILLLGETLYPKQIAGMVMIGAGLALIDGRPVRFLGRAF